MLSVITLFKFLPSFVMSNLIIWDCEYPTAHNLPPNNLVSTDDSEKSHWWLQNDDFIIFITLPHLLARWPSPSASPLPLFHYWCGLINAFLNIQCLLPSSLFLLLQLPQIWPRIPPSQHLCPFAMPASLFTCLTSDTRSSGLALQFLCPRPGISCFRKEPWFSFVVNSI